MIIRSKLCALQLNFTFLRDDKNVVYVQNFRDRRKMKVLK